MGVTLSFRHILVSGVNYHGRMAWLCFSVIHCPFMSHVLLV